MNTKKILINAMKELVEEKPFSTITVQDILDKAEVSRYTFYRYYSDKYELANAYYESYVTTHILSKFDGTNWEECNSDITHFVKEHSAYFSNVVSTDKNNEFMHFIRKYSNDFYKKVFLHNTGKQTLSTEDEYKLLAAVESGCSIFLEWIKKNCPEDPEDINRWIIESTPKIFIKYEKD